MLPVPIDVRCNFCVKTFCCLECRVKHEKSKHQDEMNRKIREEYLRSICYICRGEQFPIKMNQVLSSELIQHFIDEHLPLKCDKCLKIFSSVNDFQSIGKCCSIDPSECQEVIANKENMADNISAEKKCDNDETAALTPMSKINLRWRRKSREFPNKSDDISHLKSEPQSETDQKRQTSTPVNGVFDSLSSMQYSSINCMSSSSETDLSPPLPSKMPPIVVSSPKSIKKNASLSKSRTKLAVQNTPLRQVMTKSIQRAMVTHGHYKHVHLQQRKMTFDSSTSSNEQTISLMKLNVDTEEYESSVQPLDLRLSPAIRRTNHETENHVQFKEIKVVLRRCESESSSLTSYQSCYSNHFTPKGSTNNILKKTISFETSAKVEETPGFLMPTKSFNDDSDIFYTPKASPVRRVKSLDSFRKTNSSGSIWSFVTSVMGNFVTGTKHDEKKSSNRNRWMFNFGEPLKAAASYFGKYSETIEEADKSSESEDEISSHKRPRATITSPIETVPNLPTCKRRKIQGRKPIERMRYYQ